MKTKAKGIPIRCPADRPQARRGERAAYARFRLLQEEGRGQVAAARRLLHEIQRRHAGTKDASAEPVR